MTTPTTISQARQDDDHRVTVTTKTANPIGNQGDATIAKQHAR